MQKTVPREERERESTGGGATAEMVALGGVNLWRRRRWAETGTERRDSTGIGWKREEVRSILATQLLRV